MPRGVEMTGKSQSARTVSRHKPEVIVLPQQGTDEWKQQRAGKITASRIADVIGTLKNGGESAERRKYRIQLVTERLTGNPCDYTMESFAMRWGREQEPFARIAYEEMAHCKVVQTGFLDHPTIPNSGASPDGLVGDDGLVEIKCPESFTHINYLLAGVVPCDYKPQMVWQMLVTGRPWCDFVSYDSRFTGKAANLRLFIKRLNIADVPTDLIERITQGILGLDKEVCEMVLQLSEFKNEHSAYSL